MKSTTDPALAPQEVTDLPPISPELHLLPSLASISLTSIHDVHTFLLKHNHAWSELFMLPVKHISADINGGTLS